MSTQTDSTEETPASPLPWRKHDMEAGTLVDANGKAIALFMSRHLTDEESETNLSYVVALAAENDALRKALEGSTNHLGALVTVFGSEMPENVRRHVVAQFEANCAALARSSGANAAKGKE